MAHRPGSPATYPPGFARERIGLAIRDAADACPAARCEPPAHARDPDRPTMVAPPRNIDGGNSTSRWNREFCARSRRGSPRRGRVGAESVRFERVGAAPTANLPESHRAGAVFGLRPPKSLQRGGISMKSAVFPTNPPIRSRNVGKMTKSRVFSRRFVESGPPHTEPRWKGECEGKGGVFPLALSGASGGEVPQHGHARSLASRPILDPP